MNVPKYEPNQDYFLLKLFIYSQTESQVNCIQLSINPFKTLKEIGLFLYLDEKINFNDFLFTDQPVSHRFFPTPTKKHTHSKTQLFDEETQSPQQYIIFDSGLSLRQIRQKLHKDENEKSLIMMYSKKQMEAIVQGTVEEDNRKSKKSKVANPMYRNSGHHQKSQCLTF